MPFEATVEDDEDGPEHLTVEWSSDVDSVFVEGLASEATSLSFAYEGLSEAGHNITLTVTDRDGYVNSDSAFIVVSDCSSSWYRDLDGDGYGDDEEVYEACMEPSGYVATGGDCDDSNVEVNPGAAEACNGIDDNCNGTNRRGLQSVDVLPRRRRRRLRGRGCERDRMLDSLRLRDDHR